MNRYILFFLCLSFSLYSGEENQSKKKVLFCIDGDTFFTSGEQTEIIRLWGVDAPELDQRYGRVARSALMELCNQKRCKVEHKGNSYGRTVGTVKYKDLDVGLELIKMGLAWHDPKYAPQQKNYAEAQEKAKSDRRGLWSDPNPIPPWIHRKNRKAIEKE